MSPLLYTLALIDTAEACRPLDTDATRAVGLSYQMTEDAPVWVRLGSALPEDLGIYTDDLDHAEVPVVRSILGDHAQLWPASGWEPGVGYRIEHVTSGTTGNRGRGRS